MTQLIDSTAGSTGYRHSVIIGCGFGGLAAALRMRARGRQVTVIDRLLKPGGRATQFNRGPFTYDAGPTVLTAPVLFEELFALFGEKLADAVTLLPVTPWYQMRFADGTHLNYGGSTCDIQGELARLSPNDALAYPEFLAHTQRLFDKGYTELGSQAFLGWTSMAKAVPAMALLRADRSVYAMVSRYFEDERIRRAFSIQPLLVGGNPFTTTSIYGLIHALERKWGVWFVKGGMHALVVALVALAQRHGVQFEWGVTATAIVLGSNSLGKPTKAAVRSVTLDDGRRLTCDTVVSNADPAYILEHLLPPSHALARARHKKKFSMGLFVLYFSTNQTYPELPHHTILFGRTYLETLKNIFDGDQLPSDLSIYLHRPAATDPACAPPGHDSFYALVPVPNLKSSINWLQCEQEFKSLLISELERRALPGLSTHLVDEFHVTPQYFEDELLSPWGSGFSIQPTLLQSAGFRYPNRSPSIDGLYFVGAGTHPGAGVPGVVTSAKVVERLMFGSVA